MPILLTNCSSGVHLGPICDVFWVPGTLENNFKTLKGIQFSHFGGAFCRYDFQARSGGCFLVDVHDFLHFLGPFWGVFWDKNMNKWSIAKPSEK